MTDSETSGDQMRAELLHASSLPMFAAHSSGRIDAHNRAAEQATGLPAERITGRYIWELQAEFAAGGVARDEATAEARAAFEELYETAVRDPIHWHRSAEIDLIALGGEPARMHSETFPLLVDHQVQIVALLIPSDETVRGWYGPDSNAAGRILPPGWDRLGAADQPHTGETGAAPTSSLARYLEVTLGMPRYLTAPFIPRVYVDEITVDQACASLVAQAVLDIVLCDAARLRAAGHRQPVGLLVRGSLTDGQLHLDLTAGHDLPATPAFTFARPAMSLATAASEGQTHYKLIVDLSRLETSSQSGPV